MRVNRSQVSWHGHGYLQNLDDELLDANESLKSAHEQLIQAE